MLATYASYPRPRRRPAARKQPPAIGAQSEAMSSRWARTAAPVRSDCGRVPERRRDAPRHARSVGRGGGSARQHAVPQTAPRARALCHRGACAGMQAAAFGSQRACRGRGCRGSDRRGGNG